MSQNIQRSLSAIIGLLLDEDLSLKSLKRSSKCSAMSSLYLHNIEIMLW